MVLVRVSWARGRWRRGSTTGGRARRAGGGGPPVSCGVGGNRLVCLPGLASACPDNESPGQVCRRGGRRPCNRAGRAGAGGVARQPQTSKHVRCEGRATAWTLMGVESTQVQWRDHVDDEACHMVRRQTCAEHDGGIEGCFVIGGCAF